MAQKLLNDSNINTIAKKQRGNRVTKHVWRDMPVDASTFSNSSDDVRDALS